MGNRAGMQVSAGVLCVLILGVALALLSVVIQVVLWPRALCTVGDTGACVRIPEAPFFPLESLSVAAILAISAGLMLTVPFRVWNVRSPQPAVLLSLGVLLLDVALNVAVIVHYLKITRWPLGIVADTGAVPLVLAIAAAGATFATVYFRQRPHLAGKES